jgi:hypothetical protein
MRKIIGNLMGTQELKNSILPSPFPPKGKKMNLVGCVFLDMVATIFLPLLITPSTKHTFLLGLSHTFNVVVSKN